MDRLSGTCRRIVDRLRLVWRDVHRRMVPTRTVHLRGLRSYRGQADPRLRMWRHTFDLDLYAQPKEGLIDPNIMVRLSDAEILDLQESARAYAKGTR